MYKKERGRDNKAEAKKNAGEKSRTSEPDASRHKFNKKPKLSVQESNLSTTGTRFTTFTVSKALSLRTGKYVQIVKDLRLNISEETYGEIALNLPYFEKKYENFTDPPDVPMKDPFSKMQIESDWSPGSHEDLFDYEYFENCTTPKG